MDNEEIMEQRQRERLHGSHCVRGYRCPPVASQDGRPGASSGREDVMHYLGRVKGKTEGGAG